MAGFLTLIRFFFFFFFFSFFLSLSLLCPFLPPPFTPPPPLPPPPSQRISQEVQELADSFANIWGFVFTPAVDVAWFSYMLIKFVGGKRVMPMVGYMVGVWVLLRLVTPNKELLAQRLVIIIIIISITKYL